MQKTRLDVARLFQFRIWSASAVGPCGRLVRSGRFGLVSLGQMAAFGFFAAEGH